MVKTKEEDTQMSTRYTNGLVEPMGCVKIPTDAEEQEELLKTNEKVSCIQDYL